MTVASVVWPAHSVGDRFENNTGAISVLWQTLIALVSLRFGFELRCVHRDERCNSRRTVLDHYPRMQWQATHVHQHHPLKQKIPLIYAAGRFGLDRLGKYSIIRRPAMNSAPETELMVVFSMVSVRHGADWHDVYECAKAVALAFQKLYPAHLGACELEDC